MGSCDGRIVTHGGNRDLPDATGGVPCCYGYVNDGPGGCTCWVPVFDVEQAAPNISQPSDTRTVMCVDCAYRKGSPERSGDPDAAGDEDFLDRLVANGEPFWCHQGVRRPVSLRHPTGLTIPASPLNYWPLLTDGRGFKADGSPMDYCAGWAARRLKHQWAMSQRAKGEGVTVTREP